MLEPAPWPVDENGTSKDIEDMTVEELRSLFRWVLRALEQRAISINFADTVDDSQEDDGETRG